MTNNGVGNNAWVKLALVSLVAIVLIFAVLWGANSVFGYHNYGNMNMGYRYQMNGMNGMNGYGYQMNGMNGQGQMNMQGNMSGSMNGGMQGGMGMMNGMGMMGGNMQGGMGMY
jgi:hypothetical protein